MPWTQLWMEQDNSAHLSPVDPVETAGSGGCGGHSELAENAGGPCPGPGLLLPQPRTPQGGGRTWPRTARIWLFRATHHPGSTTWGTVSRMSGTWLQHLLAPVERSKGQGWVRTEPGAHGSSTGQAPVPHPSPAGASQCGRDRAPGRCLLGPPQCPVARLEDRAGSQQLAVPHCPALRGLSGTSVLPPALLVTHRPP